MVRETEHPHHFYGDDQRIFPYGGAIPFLTGLAVSPLLFGGYGFGPGFGYGGFGRPFFGPGFGYGGFGRPFFGPGFGPFRPRPFFW
ncbi:MAG: penicillin-binding protein [Bacillaceae bacterium]|nr:penicillin-binding protein [Bacillaceae bacterium]